VSVEDRLKHFLSVMEAIPAFEQDTVGLSDPLSSVILQPFVAICYPHRSFRVDRPEGPDVS
jgi:hypothetical protein